MVHLPFLRLGRAVGGRTSPDISGWREWCGPRTCLGRISALQSLLTKLPLGLRELLHPVKEKLVRRFFLYNTGKTLGEESLPGIRSRSRKCLSAFGLNQTL